MHEYGMMASLLERAIEEARLRGGQTVLRLRVEVGQLAGVSPEALRTAFAALVPDTIAEGAQLELTRIPGRILCEVCGLEASTVSSPDEENEESAPPLCPRCGVPAKVVAGGHVALVEVAVTLDSRDAGRAEAPRAPSRA